MQIVWLLSLAGGADEFDDGVAGPGDLLTFPLPLPRTVTILFCGRSVLLLRRRNHHTPNNPRPLTSNFANLGSVELCATILNSSCSLTLILYTYHMKINKAGGLQRWPTPGDPIMRLNIRPRHLLDLTQRSAMLPATCVDS